MNTCICVCILELGMGMLPGRETNHTVIYSSFVDQQSSSPLIPDSYFASKLVDQGVKRIVVGHKPQGDAPLPIQGPHGLKIIMADSSYAKSGNILLAFTHTHT